MPLKLSLSSASPLSLDVDLLVLLVPEGGAEKSPETSALLKALGPAGSRAVKREEWTGKKDQLIEFAPLDKAKPARVALLGTGKAALTDADVRAFAARAARLALTHRATTLAIQVPAGVEHAVRGAAEGLVLGSYRFTRYLTGDRKPKSELGSAIVVEPSAAPSKGQGAAKAAKATKATKGGGAAELALGQRIGQAITIARDLINEPPNELYPDTLAKMAVKVALENKLKVVVFDEKAIAKRGMQLITAVGQGSARKPRVVHMTYTPAGGRAKKRLVFVGKGLTFDTGGICIKPAPGMEEMKGDMGGAANVIALMAAVAAVKPNVEVHGIIGCAENMPDGLAYRPGDIFGSLDGKTVEIINTDAEGRLVLADCLAYARSLKPDLILDNATLTGACIVALGMTVSGFYANRDELADRMKKASKSAGEAMWHMPLVEDLREGLKSDWADIKHTADRWGGSITAALFLREFVGDTPWIHVDIAGPSMANRAYNVYAKGGTGHGVLTYLRLIEDHAAG